MQEQLKALSQREGVTLFMTVLAAFQVLLARYSGQSDLAIGTPIANRTHAEVEGLIGFFVNTLVLRSDLSGNPPFVQVLKRVREVALGAYVHQDVPFEKIVEVLQPERDLSRSPLFQVMFVLQNIPASSAPALPGLRLMQIEREVQTSKFDLTLTVTETAQGLHCLLEYNTDLFEALTVTRLLSCWQILLEGIVAAPQQRIAALPLLTPVERQFIIHDLNRTQRTFPTDRCIHTLFEEQVERTPDAVAVVFADQQITYLALDRRASRVAQHLQGLGVGPEVLVGICMERSVAWIVGVLAILKAGGAYVPLDPNAPKERLVGILEDTQLRILLVQEHLRERFAALPGTHVSTDAEWDLLVQEENPLMVTVTRAAVPSNLAYVIYTSGSTGRPKGVPITHENVVSSLFARLACYREPIASYLLLSPFFFDSSVAGLFWTLSQGGRLVVPSETFQQDLSEVPALLERAAISHMLCIPSLYAFVLSSASARQLAALRVVIVAGEACPVSLVKQHRQSVPQVTLCNEYGPTEGTVWSSVYQDHAEELTSRIPIGDPIATVQIYLLDPMLQPVPMGVAGELYIAGSGLARGYLNAASLTAEKFLPHPFAERVGERVYRTGDRARYNAQGSIEFLGRVDDQVKLRGYRIELSEIEAILNQQEGVKDSLVLLREERSGSPELVAYVIARESVGLSIEKVRRGMQTHLPEYMLPSAFIVLDAFPLTPNGKVDRRVLPLVEMTPAVGSGQITAGRSVTEELVGQIWSEVLDRIVPGLHENFFTLGGHSLLATQVVARMKAVLQIEVPLRSIFEAPTIASFTVYVGQLLQHKQGIILSTIVPVPQHEESPLSFPQQRLWFIDQLEAGNIAYNLPLFTRLSGVLDIAAMERSIAEIVQRHEILRTTFRLTPQGQPIQVVVPYVRLASPLIDLSILSGEECEAEAQRISQDEACQPFNLVKGPLLRCKLLRLSRYEHILLLSMHHIISDAWSLGIFIHDLTTLYTSLVEGVPSPLLPLPLQYADFSIWQRQMLQGESLKMLVNYWTKQLGGGAASEIPTDYPRPKLQSYRGASYFFTFSPQLSQMLVALSRKESVTLFMSLLAAFQVLLYRYTGQEDIQLGTDIANRTLVETENLIGFFINVLVLRMNLGGAPSFRTLLSRVREMILGAYAHQDMPFDLLVDLLSPGHAMDRMPLAQILFVFQNTPTPSLIKVPGLTLSPWKSENPSAKFDVALFLSESPTGLNGSVIYNTDLFALSTIVSMVKQFETLLNNIVMQPDIAVNAVEIHTEDEKTRLGQQKQSRRQLKQRALQMSKRKDIDLSRIGEATNE